MFTNLVWFSAEPVHEVLKRAITTAICAEMRAPQA
jgi:hypothetical protein